MASWYDISSGGLIFLFIVVTVLISISGLYMVNQITSNKAAFPEGNTVTTIYVGFVGVVVGLILSFIIVDVWQSYSKAISNVDAEAETIFLLYGIIYKLPNSEQIQHEIKSYLSYIINEEFASLLNNTVPPQGRQHIKSLQTMLYDYNPQSDKDSILYGNALSSLEKLTSLRIERITSGTSGLPPELWAVLIIGILILIIVTWFIMSDSLYHYILNALFATYVAAALALTVLLGNPFSGGLAISPQPFEIALANINNLYP